MTSFFDHEALENFFNKVQLPARKRRTFRRLYFREFESLTDSLNNSELEKEIVNKFEFPKLKVVTKQDSQLDGATKILFETHDGLQIETVILRIDTGRTSLCISSQAGCTEKCTFCSTATLGFKRNLTLTEIVGQVMFCGELLRREQRNIRNIVFMGMGEPLRNPENVFPALRVMISSAYMGLSPKRVTISTIGVTDQIIKLRKIYPEINLALSLHAPNDEIRDLLMPINKRDNMANIKETLCSLDSGRLMIQYLLIKGLNDKEEQAQELSDFLRGIDCIINLIPYNNSLGVGQWMPCSDEQMLVFQDVLQNNFFQVTRRHSLGKDIDAACGQLAAKYKIT